MKRSLIGYRLLSQLPEFFFLEPDTSCEQLPVLGSK